jgi:hypothetical protein
MKKIIYTLSLLIFMSATAFAQTQEANQPSLWKTLSKITYKKEYNELMGFKIDIPVFSQEILDLEGETVEVKGYIIPVEGYESHTEFILSAFPYSMCFFCGGAGPETVMEVEAIEGVEYDADQIVLRGTLQLNADDINRLMYIITDAELVK